MGYGAIASAAGGMISGGISTALGNTWAKNASQVDRNFQERMSGSAYQRAMADMRKAGLNPMLAAKTGGASTPSGSKTQPADLGANLSKGVAAAQAVQQMSTAKAQEEHSTQQGLKLKHENVKNKIEADIYDSAAGTAIKGTQMLKKLRFQLPKLPKRGMFGKTAPKWNLGRTQKNKKTPEFLKRNTRDPYYRMEQKLQDKRNYQNKPRGR